MEGNNFKIGFKIAKEETSAATEEQSRQKDLNMEEAKP